MTLYFIDYIEDTKLWVGKDIRVPGINEEVYVRSKHWRVASILTDLDNKRIQIYLITR